MVNLEQGVDVVSHLQGLSSNGPVALYDGQFRTLVIAPLDNFKQAVHSNSGNLSTALVQLYSSERLDHVLCAMGSQCWDANQGVYELERIEGMQPTTAQTEREAQRRGCHVTDITQSLYDFFSIVLEDNLVTNATKPPHHKGYCSQPESCFSNGLVYRIQINGTIPLQLYWNSNGTHSLTVASPEGVAFAKTHGFVFAAVVGYVYPPPSTGVAWETGVSSEVNSLPIGFSHRTVLSAGKGITATLNQWGRGLRALHSTDRMDTSDPVVNKLSYWTDNGAYY